MTKESSQRSLFISAFPEEPGVRGTLDPEFHSHRAPRRRLFSKSFILLAQWGKRGTQARTEKEWPAALQAARGLVA